MKLLQINLGRARAAHDLVIETALAKEVDIIMASEPNKKIAERGRWLKDQRGDAAILVRNKQIKMKGFKSAQGWVRLDLETISIYSCYISPNINIKEFGKTLDEIMEDVLGRRREVVITGDFNAKSPVWGSPAIDERGERIGEWMSTLNLIALNDGSPTFERRTSVSHIDLTIASSKVGGKITKWEVLDVESLSDHKYITFEIKGQEVRKVTERRTIFFDTNIYTREITSAKDRIREEKTPKRIIKIIKTAQKAATTQNKNKVKMFPYWWNSDITNKRNETNIYRRELVRIRKKQGCEIEIRNKEDRVKSAQKELKKLINAAKKSSWKEVCDKVEEDVWGDGYKITVKHFAKPLLPCELGKAEKIAITKELFPIVGRDEVSPGRERDIIVKPFTKHELERAASKIKTGKSPGPDKIIPEAMKLAAIVLTEELLEMYNSLLAEGKFPEEWQTARVVLIPKGGAKDGNNMKFRTICLLDTPGKLYEALLKIRLEEELEEKNAISDNQYGFRTGRSTIQAAKWVVDKVKQDTRKWCAFIALDIKNAFNTASWNLIKKNLERIGISPYLWKVIADYLSNREVVVEGESIIMTGGVPQGSVLGPTLWNVLYNGVLELNLPEGCETIAFADDLGLIVRQNNDKKLVTAANEALLKIENWMKANQLTLAANKTEAVILKGPRKREHVKFKLAGVDVEPKKSLKYLGIFLDVQMNFGAHIKEAAAKADRTTARLSRIMPNIGGATSQKRELLYRVSESILLYGAPVWSSMVERISAYKNILAKSQRKGLIRVASAYRTVSTEALQVITAIPPIDLLAKERRLIHETGQGQLLQVRAEKRKETIREWQNRWQQLQDKAQWTKELIPSLDKWINCKHRNVNYYLTQFLTGHGSFRKFTHRIGKSADDKCLYCGEVDSPAHTILNCPRWQFARGKLWQELKKELDVLNIVDEMLENRKKYELIKGYIVETMTIKELEERANQEGKLIF